MDAKEKFKSKLLEAFSAHLHQPEFSVSFLADEVFFTTRRNLRRKAKLYLGESMKSFIIHARMHLAKQLIKAGSYESLDDLHLLVGYKSHRYFEKEFLKHHLLSPEEMLEEYKHQLDGTGQNKEGKTAIIKCPFCGS
ncbi:MAG: helix-turn-helix transcriptional regulator [Bacteroidetes bacterium]|nr:helix-turn-helix transcriptional regulator [Bacteroidota bacterium]